MHYALFYEYGSDHLQRRGDFRGEHLSLARQAEERGELVLAGAFSEAPYGALFVFDADEPAAIERFVMDDPYVKHGLVASWQIRPWTTVVGKDAKTPIRPDGLG